MGLANISIVGNVTRPPLHATFPTGNKTTLTVAVNSTRKADGTETADFYRVEVWGKMGDVAARYITKGHQITAIGRFYLDHWTDRNGKERTTPTIQATQISLPPKRGALEIAGAAESASARDTLHMTEDEEDRAAQEMYGTTVTQPGSSIHQPASPAGTSSPPTEAGGAAPAAAAPPAGEPHSATPAASSSDESAAHVAPRATPPPDAVSAAPYATPPPDATTVAPLATPQPAVALAPSAPSPSPPADDATAESIFAGTVIATHSPTVGTHAMPFTDEDDFQSIVNAIASGAT